VSVGDSAQARKAGTEQQEYLAITFSNRQAAALQSPSPGAFGIPQALPGQKVGRSSAGTPVMRGIGGGMRGRR